MEFIVEPENTIEPECIFTCTKEQYCFECYENTTSNDTNPSPWTPCPYKEWW